MFDWQLYGVLVITLGVGFFLGWRHHAKKSPVSAAVVDGHYFEGLNFLLNEQPDAAIDTFIRALEVNSDTLETHLALGKMLRKRGEVDRAIRIHQNLLARPGLTLIQIQQAQYELATDFVKSGLFDRAEGLLKELVVKDGPYRVVGLERLLEVYRDEKEWLQGLDVLKKLAGSRLGVSYEEWAPIRAHFCCELAEKEIASKNHLAAGQWVKQALGYDKYGVRAGLLLGQLEVEVGSLQKGILQLQKVATQHADYIAEVIPHLSLAYQQLGGGDAYGRFLSSLYAETCDTGVSIAIAELVAKKEGHLAAAEYIAQEVISRPSSEGLHKLLEYYLAFSEGNTHQYLLSLQSVIGSVIINKLHYQCKHCGFKGKRLHWLCPSCKKWGSSQAIKA
jgi:lipopolysaccharide biosynthesis regulator YciM